MARTLSTSRRFRVAYLVLAALFGAAVGAFIVLQRDPGPQPPPQWSAWQPTGNNQQARERQIAQHVEQKYHLTSGQKLVDVLARGPVNGSIREVGIAKSPNPTDVSDFSFVPGDTTAMYILCGKPPKCAIQQGTPSIARGAVLRREALELALYTFRYVDGIDSVVTFFPPPKGRNAAYAFYFGKSDFSSELHRPLQETLPQGTTPMPGTMTSGELKTVDELTGQREFRFALGTDQSGAPVLFLAPTAG